MFYDHPLDPKFEAVVDRQVVQWLFFVIKNENEPPKWWLLWHAGGRELRFDCTRNCSLQMNAA